MSDSLPKLSENPVSPVNHIDYNSIDAAQMKSTKMQKSKTTSTPQKPKIQKSKATSIPQKPKLKKSKKASSSLLENAKQSNKRKGGRMSAKEYRKIFWRFILYMIGCEFSLAFVLFLLMSLTTDSPAEVLWFSIYIAPIVSWIVHMVLFFTIGIEKLGAQCQRINDLGWNGNLLVSLTFTSVLIIPLYYSYIASTELVFNIQCIAILWGLILEGISLFKKGQAIPNKYGSPCNDDN